MKKFLTIFFLLITLGIGAQMPVLKIAQDHRSFSTADGKPFFWLGDTGWLLFKKCNKEETIQYLNIRQQQGFNVIQVMLLHELTVTDANGDSALINKDASKPNTVKHYWDHVDFVIQEAAKRNMYLALVPVWGGNVKSGHVNEAQALAYASFLAERYKKYNNIIWMNGGDIKGSDGEAVWNIIGKTLHEKDGRHLISFHPRGRSTSSTWFHQKDWLDFNMFQSGHKDYAQDTVEPRMGEDNWRYVQNDLALQPLKPTMDAEPSYENIPHGLHDSLAARWTANDIRRYAYWSILAGGAGFTYGENSVMQFKNSEGPDNSFGAVKNWKETMQSPAANQMKYLKKLVESKAWLNRKPAAELVMEQGEKYRYIPVLELHQTLWAYDYTGRQFQLNLQKYAGKKLRAAWYNPRNGEWLKSEIFKAQGHKNFDPPGKELEGNDWVLQLEIL